MSRNTLKYLTLLFFGLAVACGDETAPNQTNLGDVGIDFAQDVSSDFASPLDMGPDSADMGVTTADMGDDAAADVGGIPDMSPTAMGVITGECGDIDMTEILSSQPFLFVNTIDFQNDPYDDVDFDRLTLGGQEIITDGNAGGSSIFSEVFSFEVLNRCDMAILLKTETEVVYDVQGKITDLLVSLDALKVGVSVTRAVSFPRDTPYTAMTAQNLMDKKLADILVSSANVAAEDAWKKQILHVLVDRPEHVPVLEAALMNVDPAVRADTVVVLTVTEGNDDFIY
jgi:hypothetical protein